MPAGRGALQVVAAEPAKKKGLPSQVKRAIQSEERRQHNKSIKSATYTSVKKASGFSIVIWHQLTFTDSLYRAAALSCCMAAPLHFTRHADLPAQPRYTG